MKTSRVKFVILFVIGAFAFQFITNSVLGPEVRLFPINGDPFPGSESLVVWKNALGYFVCNLLERFSISNSFSYKQDSHIYKEKIDE